jgi:hypothetical protein
MGYTQSNRIRLANRVILRAIENTLIKYTVIKI